MLVVVAIVVVAVELKDTRVKCETTDEIPVPEVEGSEELLAVIPEVDGGERITGANDRGDDLTVCIEVADAIVARMSAD